MACLSRLQVLLIIGFVFVDHAVLSAQQDRAVTTGKSGVIARSANFAYDTIRAKGRSSVELARVKLHLPKRMQVHIRATTGVITLAKGRTSLATGFYLNGLPKDITKLGAWNNSGRYITIPTDRQWVTCSTSFAIELNAGTHTIYWSVGDVQGGEVRFDAGSMSVMAFPLVDSAGNGEGSEPSTQKLAVLVGINRYLAAPRVSNLRGCVNDVNDMYDLLTKNFGFKDSDIRVLTNEQATHGNIIEAVQEHLIKKAKKDALVVFYYSGHGSQALDEKNGDEADGLDETIVPHDSRLNNVHDITDDMINGLLVALSNKTRNITFIFDSCHSGTAAKALGATPRRAPIDRRVPPPAPKYAQAARGLSGKGNYVFLSGCNDNELSYELLRNRQHRGAMTFFLTREIRNTRNNDVTYQQIMEKVKANVNAVYRSQHPQIEGANMKDLVFKAKSTPTSRNIVATQRAAYVVINAGRAHGVTKGSIYHIYPANSPIPQIVGDSSVAQIQITNVSEFGSEGELIKGGPLNEPGIAVERSHAFIAERFPIMVDLKGTSRDQAVANSKTLIQLKNSLVNDERYNSQFELVDEVQAARLVLSENKKGDIEILAGNVELQPRLVLDTKATADKGAEESVLKKLEHWHRWVKLAFLENPNSELDVDLFVRGIGGQDNNKDRPRFQSGQEIEFTVKNNSDKDLHISLLDFSGDGSISIINETPELVKAGKEYRVRTPVFVQKDFTEIQDIVKVFATVQEADFRFLQQGAAPKGVDFAVALFDRAVGHSKGASVKPINVNDWTTASVVFDVVK